MEIKLFALFLTFMAFMAIPVNAKAAEVSEEDEDLLARLVFCEAGNQSLDGKRLVVDVVLNRVADEDFPDTIRGVIFQKWQFTPAATGWIWRVVPTEECIRAVEMELEEVGWPGVIYFRTGRFSDYGTPWQKVGDHYFSTK